MVLVSARKIILNSGSDDLSGTLGSSTPLLKNFMSRYENIGTGPCCPYSGQRAPVAIAWPGWHKGDDPWALPGVIFIFFPA
jgi:hypothetical protein